MIRWILLGCLGLGLLWAGNAGVGSYLHREWRGLGRFTIIRLDDDLVVESVDPKTKQGTRLIVPALTEIVTVERRGAWKPAALAVLGQKYGLDWVGESVADFLGITYTAVYGQMRVWDKLAWWTLAGSAQWREVNLDETRWITQETAADGVKVLGLATDWESKTADLFYSTTLANSKQEVRVFNATEEVGLAARVAGRIESAGVRVITVDELEKEVAGCEVASARRERTSEVVQWLMTSFECEWVEDELLGKIIDVTLGKGFAARIVGEQG